MKKLYSLVLIISLLILSGSVMAAPHNYDNDFSSSIFSTPDYGWVSDFGFVTENLKLSNAGSFMPKRFSGWYYIEKDAPKASIEAQFPKDANNFGLEYFKNDQTFAQLSVLNQKGDDTYTDFRGSYLFDKLGLFVGLIYSKEGDYSQTVFSPGYRLSLGDDNYLALSTDYALNGDTYPEDTGIIDYDISFRYYWDNARVYAQALIPNEDFLGMDRKVFITGGAVKVADNVVIGGNYTSFDDFRFYDLGVSVKMDKLAADLSYASWDSDSENIIYFTNANLIYAVTDNFQAGLQVTNIKETDDNLFYAKAQYDINKSNNLQFIYRFKNDSWDFDSMSVLKWNVVISK